MADVSIFNLPPMVPAVDPTDVIPFTDVSDHVESPQGTTKKMLVSQLGAAALTVPVIISGAPGPQLVINATPAPNLPTLAWQQVGVQWGGIQWLAAGTMSIFNQVSAEVARLTQGNLVLNGTITTGASGSRLGDPNGTSILTLGSAAPSADAAAQIKFINTNAFQNWQLGVNSAASGVLDFTPSTVAGGQVFTTPVFRLSPNGNLTVTGSTTLGPGVLTVNGDAASGSTMILAFAGAGVGPIVRLFRSAAVARIWQMRLGTDGTFQFVDETAGTLNATFDIVGTFTSYKGLVGMGSPGVTSRAGAGGAAAQIWMLNGTGGVGHLNWEIEKSKDVLNALQFTPSTAADGIVFTTPVMNLTNTGQLTTLGNHIISPPATALIQLNPTGGGANSAQVQYMDNGAAKWQVGNNVFFGGQTFEFYSNGLATTVLGLSPSGTATFYYPVTASQGVFVPNNAAVLIANGGAATTNKYMQFVNAGNNVLIGIETNAGSTLLAGALPYAFVMGPSVAAPLQLFTNNSLRLTFDAAGVCFIGSTSLISALGAAAGEVVLANGKSLKGSNNAVNNTIPMIAIDSFDHIVLGGGTPQTLVRIGQVAPASMPAGSVNNTGGIMVDTTNNRLCYWSGGSRYFIPIGTIF